MEKQPLIKKGWIRALVFMTTFLVMNIILAFITGNIRGSKTTGSSDILQGEMLFYILVSAFIAFVTVVFFRRLIDRKSLYSLGLQWSNNEPYAATGFFMAILLLGIGSLILIANNNLHWSDMNFDGTQLFLGLGLMTIVAFAEELVFRGYILNNLLESLNKWLALGISAGLFAIFHANNNGINPVALINIFVAGMILGINYIYTRNLWFGILFHLSWNFYQGSVLGYKVSGLNLKSLLEQDLSGNDFLTGANFGFEGSLLATILLSASFALLFWTYEKRFNGTALNRASLLQNK